MLKLACITILMLFLLTSCSPGKQSEANFSISMGALVANLTFSGGTTLRLVNPSTGRVINADLTPPYKMLIPHGTWNLYLVGFDGAGEWQGPHQCGSLLNVNFSTPEKTITFLVASGNCGIEPYLSMISSKSPSPSSNLFDTAVWGTATWGP